jgi:sterol desaturase/sphingolipid hydroxylase (fatty acid hydroxylase superfamily)
VHNSQCSAMKGQSLFTSCLFVVALTNAFTTHNFRPAVTLSRHGHAVSTSGISTFPSLYMSASPSPSSDDMNMKSSTRRNIFGRSSARFKSAIASSASMNFNNASNSKSPKSLLVTLFQKLMHLDEVGKWRMAAATFITSIFAFSPQLDRGLIKLWSWLKHDTTALLPRLFRHDHWEWVLAVWAFFFWIHGYWLVDRSIAKADAKGQTHRWKKYRLQDQYEGERHRRMQVRRLERGQDVDVEEKPPPTEQHKWNLGFWIFELPLYCLPLYIWDVMDPRRAPKIAAWGAPTALGVAKDVTSALLMYDLGFFVCHFLMHKIPFLYKYAHAKHHKTKEVRASDIVRLSFVEEIVDVGISIVALNTLKAHPISRSIYNVIITFLLTELHSGFAFPWTPQFVVPFGLATGSKGHHYHHRYGVHYYQKFFCHVDKLFGFVQKKDKSLKGFSVQ